MAEARESDSTVLVMSYLTLRRVVGYIGFFLPWVLLFGAWGESIQGSISDYYYTTMGDVFVGSLFVIGVFLFSYTGYKRKDDIAGDLACVFAIGVALFPTTPDNSETTIVGIIHGACAALFFITLAYFSLFLFTKSSSKTKKDMTPRKRKRNWIYKFCGGTIVGAIICILAYYILLKWVMPLAIEEHITPLNPVFWLESLAVIMFGVSWLTKGEAILGDVT